MYMFVLERLLTLASCVIRNRRDYSKTGLRYVQKVTYWVLCLFHYLPVTLQSTYIYLYF